MKLFFRTQNAWKGRGNERHAGGDELTEIADPVTACRRRLRVSPCGEHHGDLPKQSICCSWSYCTGYIRCFRRMRCQVSTALPRFLDISIDGAITRPSSSLMLLLLLSWKQQTQQQQQQQQKRDRNKTDSVIDGISDHHHLSGWLKPESSSNCWAKNWRAAACRELVCFVHRVATKQCRAIDSETLPAFLRSIQFAPGLNVFANGK